MKVVDFRADADLVGRRAKVSWTLLPENGETLVDAPRLRLRAKRHDFEFPTPDDPFVVYDSGDFPLSGTVLAAEVERAPDRSDGLVTEEVIETASVALAPDATPVEAGRRTRWTTVDQGGNLVSRREEILDVGGGVGLPAGEPRYYELAVEGDAVPIGRAIVTPTEAHGTARRLYDLVPTAYRRHDVVGPPGSGATAVGAIPETAVSGGQLRRFVDLVGLAADHLRSRAEQLRDVHDVTTGDARYLPYLAATVGWDLDQAAVVPEQRHEVRFASTLYRLTGTSIGCQLWVKRLTGWDATIVEFWRNVLFSNDLGSGLASDRGSRTLDAADADLLARRGGPDDTIDYTHDSRATQDARYVLNAIGIFVTPEADELTDPTALFARRDKLLANTGLFLPLNLRAVVVLDLPTDTSGGDTLLGVTASTDPT